MLARRLTFALLPGLFFACSPASTNGRLPDGDGASPTVVVTSTSSTSVDPGPAKAGFENPGGMWLPEQLALQASTFKGVGFRLDPMLLTKPTEFPLGAVISLGGCSASFVSPDGLIVTNHHCVTNTLQIHSKDPVDLMRDGFLAKTRANELHAGAAQKVFVTQSLRDVTATMRADLATMKDDLARYQALEDRSKKLVAECEKGQPGIRCTVHGFFGGAEYRLVEQLEIRDVRLVYAPPAGIGNYGGEIDNWRWPRHTGDFSFFRAYVGKDGKPADHGPNNVPYRPAHVLKLSKTPLVPGDAVMIAGYPAKTNRHTTATETRTAMTSDLPYTQQLCEAYVAALETVAKADPKIAGQRAQPLIRGLANTLTSVKGQIEGLAKGGALDKKVKEETELQKWIDEAADRSAKYGGVIDKTAKVFTDSRRALEADRTIREGLRVVRSFAAAHTILRNAEERAKPDAARDPEYQDRNQKRHEASFKQLTDQYSAAVDAATLRLLVERELRLPADKRMGLAEALLGKPAGEKKHAWPEAAADVEKAVKALYDTTKIGDEAARSKLLTKASVEELKNSKDPLIKLLVAIRPQTKEFEERLKKLDGAMSLVQPVFVSAMREKAKGLLAPDANRTLRITYGTVRGYTPRPGAPAFTPFTKLSEVVQKNTGTKPFNAPKALLEMAAAKKFGPYADEKLGEVPVDFLSDLDITGGNSGSATLNARGELVGLAFDGNYESQAQSWIFIPELTRTIHVDLRYILWVLDAVSGADELLREMGVEPSLP